jgi:hypothetical protein
VPGFQAHITGSSIVGAGYAAAAWYVGGMPPVTCLLGGSICAAAGMLPDLDSGSSGTMRESVAVAAAVVPLVLFQRFQQMGVPMVAIILLGAAIYAVIRFGGGWLLENYSAHRGMFHSLPAAAIAGQVTYLAFGHEEPMRRYFIAGAVVLGFITHLVIDEIWAARQGLFGAKVKKAFGTAMKFHGPVMWSNIVTYVLVLVLGLVAAGDAARTERMSHVRQQMEQAARPYQTMPPAGYYRR